MTLTTFLLQAVASLLAIITFLIVLNVQRSMLLLGGILGMAVWLIYLLLKEPTNVIVATLFGFAFSLYVEKFIRIPFVTAFAGAFVFGMIAQFWARYTGFPSTADLIIAGAVMPFVPGIALTNAVRDIMTNHINSGMSKMFESLLITLALGAGTSVALVLMN